MRAKRIALLGLLAAALLPAASHARPFNELCKQFEPFRKLSDLKYVKAVMRIQPKSQSVKPQDVVFTIHARSGPIRVVPSAGGVLELPLSDALCAENPDVEVNQPKGTLDLTVSIDPSVPPVQTLDYRLLESLRREWNEAVSRQSFVMRTMAPGV